MSKKQLAKAVPTLSKRESFFRIVEHDLKPGETYRGYQCERIEIIDDKVTARELINKPDMFEYAQSAMLDLMDPRNHVEPINPSEFV